MIFPVQQTRTTVRLFTCFICDTPYVQLSNDLSNAKNVMRNKKGRLITKLFEAQSCIEETVTSIRLIVIVTVMNFCVMENQEHFNVLISDFVCLFLITVDGMCCLVYRAVTSRTWAVSFD